jgi:hypothetical protein
MFWNALAVLSATLALLSFLAGIWTGYTAFGSLDQVIKPAAS